MIIVITLLTRHADGKQTSCVIEGIVTKGDNLVDMKNLWDAERAINEHTSIRCHIEVK